MAPVSNALSWQQKFSGFISSSALLIPDMSYEEKQLLDDALIRTYARKGITHDNSLSG